MGTIQNSMEPKEQIQFATQVLRNVLHLSYPANFKKKTGGKNRKQPGQM
jgi:hypothetical protein